jgi:hypothetical protein
VNVAAPAAAHPRFQLLRGSLLLATSAYSFYGVQYMPVPKFTAINLLTPVLATLLAAWLLLRQLPDFWGGVGMAIISACGATSAWLNLRSAAAALPPRGCAGGGRCDRGLNTDQREDPEPGTLLGRASLWRPSFIPSDSATAASLRVASGPPPRFAPNRTLAPGRRRCRRPDARNGRTAGRVLRLPSPPY